MKHVQVSSTLAITVFAAAVLAPNAWGQTEPPPTSAEYAARAEQAERAPLFASEDPLVITLRTDIKFLRDKRPDEEEIEGTLTFMDLDGTAVSTIIEVRTRGIFRRKRSNCNFPPLRFDFPKAEMEGTVFDGQDKLKLVTPCHDSRDAFQDYVYQEYLAYKTFNLMTPSSFRVRLVEITYEDINDKYDTRTKFGFLIEDQESMAERNFAVFYESGPGTAIPSLPPAQADQDYSTTMALFQFLIGNTDWSSLEFHNVKLVETQEGRMLTIPYDFDFSGVVDARYAVPDASLRIRDVRDRIYRGFCYANVQQRETFAALFNEKQDEIWELYAGFALFDDDQAKKTLEWYEDFFEIINDEKKWKRQIADACRG